MCFASSVNGRRPGTSVNALQNLMVICREHLTERYKIIPVDIHVNPEQVRSYKVIAVPTVIRESPAPVIRLIGDLSDRQAALGALVPERG
jgi:circadian clock protein KaiB